MRSLRINTRTLTQKPSQFRFGFQSDCWNDIFWLKSQFMPLQPIARTEKPKN